MSDLVEKLRDWPAHAAAATVIEMLREAADEIERLTAERDALAAADRDHLAATRGMEKRLTARAEAAESKLAEAGKALEEIVAIPNQEFGMDWEEIEHARHIARTAISSLFAH